MPPYFFLSYARRDANEAGKYLETFVSDLEDELCALTGESREGIGFRDLSGIDLGESWPESLVEALRTSRVFLALYSPAYFKSANCGKEWTAFAERCRRHAHTTGTHCPPLIVPVLWNPVQLDDYSLPSEIRDLQYHKLELGDDYCREGLRTLLRLYPDKYKAFVTRFARLLVETVKSHPLQVVPEGADYSGLTSAFDTAEATGAEPAPPASGAVGPGHVVFVILAAGSTELQNVRHCLDAYGHHGRYWYPYRPASPMHVAALVQGIASAANFSSDLLELGPGLIARLHQARENKSVLVVLVDPWSLFLPSYADRAAEYDRQEFYNGTVLVLQNDNDEETRQYAGDLQVLIERVFENKAAHCPSWGFRGIFSSPAQLAAELITALQEIRKVIIRRAEKPRKALGPRAIPLPRLTGPGGKVS